MKCARRTGTLVLEDLGGLAKVMPLAGFAFGLAAFAAIGLPGFANFAGEVMIFFGAFRDGANMERFHIFQVATVLALWGVVISAVYMLRAYRAVFMGTHGKQAGVAFTDLRARLRLPIGLLVADPALGRIFPAIIRPDRRSAVPQLISPRSDHDRRAHSRNRGLRPRHRAAAARSVLREDRQGRTSPIAAIARPRR